MQINERLQAIIGHLSKSYQRVCLSDYTVQYSDSEDINIISSLIPAFGTALRNCSHDEQGENFTFIQWFFVFLCGTRVHSAILGGFSAQSSNVLANDSAWKMPQGLFMLKMKSCDWQPRRPHGDSFGSCWTAHRQQAVAGQKNPTEWRMSIYCHYYIREKISSVQHCTKKSWWLYEFWSQNIWAEK